MAETDTTFTRQGRLWVGKCLICNGPLAFDACTGEGATLEHILARSRGGTDDPRNLGIAHASCNAEKGRRWDKKRSRPQEEYEALVQRFHERRQQRWREGPLSF
ncbi:MAG TPA: HNH endonuclease [Chloroflexia bacterium]|nr:HNH endonuclease [Chloroflexia bacterium]